MGKAFGLVLMIVAMYLGLTLYSEGVDGLLGGALAPIESRDRDDSAAARTSGLAQPGDPADAGGGVRPRTRTGQRIHDRVSADLQQGAARYDRLE